MAKDGKRLTAKKKSGALVERQGRVNTSLTSSVSVSKPKLSFSFLYFRQIDFFQLKGQKDSWFVSLIERLKDLSEKDTDILGDMSVRDKLRIHTIDWNHQNVPIKKEDLYWVPKEYLNNNEEFELFQFEISLSLGRVLGFFNEDSQVFHVVLLDPKHNLQPSKDHDYRVDKTIECLTDYEEVLRRLNQYEKQRTTCKALDRCPITLDPLNEHLLLSNRMIWLDEQLIEIYKHYSREALQEDFTNFLLSVL